MHESPGFRRFLSVLLCLLLAVIQSGCTTKPLSLKLYDKLHNQRIALVPARSDIDVTLEFFAESKSGGTLKGAGQGIAEAMGGLGGCSGDFCGAALLIVLPVAVVVGGSIGAVQGYRRAPSTETVIELEAFVDKNQSVFPSQINLSRRVLKQSHDVPGLSIDLVPLNGNSSGLTDDDLHRLKTQGYGMALMVEFECVKLADDKGGDQKLGLHVEASVRIIDTENREVQYQRNFQYIGIRRAYSEWFSVDDSVLTEEFDACLNHLAEEIVTSLFISYDLPISAELWCDAETEDYEVCNDCWICSVEPSSHSLITTLQPQLQWRPFPGEYRQSQLRKKTNYQAANVRYDLKVWETTDNQWGELVYERHALPSTTHRIEETLRPGFRYLWSVRACFDLASRVVCTPWAFTPGGLTLSSCKEQSISPATAFNFETP